MIIISGFKFSIISFFILKRDGYKIILRFGNCSSAIIFAGLSVVGSSPAIYFAIYLYIWSFIAFVGAINSIFLSLSIISCKDINDLPQPVGITTEALFLILYAFVIAVYASC